MGTRFINSYRAMNNRQSPPKVLEEPYMVYDYPKEFIEKRLDKLKKRHLKQFPDINVDQRAKRKRMTTGFAQLVNPDSNQT